MKSVLDSNILIYHLNGALTATAEAVLAKALQEGAFTSVVTRIEVLGWPDLSGEALQRAERLVALCYEQSMTSEIADGCIALRRTRRMKIPDAMIAATALALGLPLVTRNTRDFSWIDGLDLVDPFAEPRS